VNRLPELPELPEGLRAWAELDGPACVLRAIRERAARGGRTETGRLTCQLTDSGRREVGRLLGTEWVLSGSLVTLDRLANALTPHGLTVRELVEAAGGPIPDRRRQRREAEAAAEAERAEAAALLIHAGVPATVAESWLTDQALPSPGTGALADLAGCCAQLWHRLPGPTGVPVRLAVLAADYGDDAHCLDSDRPLGRAVARLAAASAGVQRPVRGGRDWREAWARVGVLCDAVSSRVLTLNLPLEGQRRRDDGVAAPPEAAVPGLLTGEAAAVRLCASAALTGEPLWLTLRSLTGRWSARPGRPAFVCENPTIVEAAADRLGAACPPMVCTDGLPTNIAVDLVRRLGEAGCPLFVRADVDAAGIAIVRMLLSVAPYARLWRYDAATYLQAVGSASQRSEADLGHAGAGVGMSEAGIAVDELTAVYEARGRPLHEENLLADLLADLDSAQSSGPALPSNSLSTYSKASNSSEDKPT
jgi:uncharacterized protein (TIGR02679 family)